MRLFSAAFLSLVACGGLDATQASQDLAPRRTVIDQDGGAHQRMTQLYKGVPVLGGAKTLHPDGSETGSIIEGLDLDVTPRLTEAQAIARAGAGTRAMLAVLPIRQDVRKTPRDPASLRDDATAYERRLTGARLVYRVTGARQTSLVDANTGELIRSQSSIRHANGTMHPRFSADRTLPVSTDSGKFVLQNATTENFVWDETGTTGNPWEQTSSSWGNNNPVTSRGTTAADAYVALDIINTLYSHVFSWHGYDGDGGSLGIGVHDADPDLKSNAGYDPGDENIHVGDDSLNRFPAHSLAAVDVLGHEFGHAITDQTAGLDQDFDDEAFGLDEGYGDMLGALTMIYFKRGAYADSSSAIPVTSGTNRDDYWNLGGMLFSDPGVVFDGIHCIRSMILPPQRYWFDGITAFDPHDVAGPFDRMFYFLSMGSDANVDSPRYSHGVPWGMDGLQNDEAGRLGFAALTQKIDDDDNYAAVHDAFVLAARDRNGTFGVDEKAVRNAFAAIDVGSVAANYPALPAVSSISGSHDTQATAQGALLDGTPTPNPNLHKRIWLGVNRTGKDDYFVNLDCGQSAAVRLEHAGDYSLAAFVEGTSTAIATSFQDQINGRAANTDLIVTFANKAGTGCTTKKFFVRVLFQGSGSFPPPLYTASFDKRG